MKLLLCLLLLYVVKSEDWIEKFKPKNQDKFIQEINQERADLAKKYGISNMNALKWNNSLALEVGNSYNSCKVAFGSDHRSTPLEPDSVFSDFFINVTVEDTGLKRNGARTLKEYLYMYKDEFFGNSTHYFGHTNTSLHSKMHLLIFHPEQTDIGCLGEFHCSDDVSPPNVTQFTVSAVGACKLGPLYLMESKHIKKGVPGGDCPGKVTGGLCGEWNAPPEETTQAPKDERILSTVVEEEEEHKQEGEEKDLEAKNELTSGGFQVNVVAVFMMVTVGVVFFY